jgi:hypothetical protein
VAGDSPITGSNGADRDVDVAPEEGLVDGVAVALGEPFPRSTIGLSGPECREQLEGRTHKGGRRVCCTELGEAYA